MNMKLTEREIELIDGMIEVQMHHAQRCDAMQNSSMAQKQKGWDLERVALLERIKKESQVEAVVKCEGGDCCVDGCEGAVKKVHVKHLKPFHDWGEFNYCDNAIKEDINRGFSVDILEA